MEKESRSHSIQSIFRAISVLRSFTVNKPILGVTELSRMTGLHKTTVSRILMTLGEERIVEKDNVSGKYRLGVELISIAAPVMVNLREIAKPLMQKLSETTQEVVDLAVLDGEQTVNIEQAISNWQIRISSWNITRNVLHASSTGKVLLAYRPPEEIERVIGRGLNKIASETITDPDLFRKELLKIRLQGFATAINEYEDGLFAVAAPIRDFSNTVIACVSTAAPLYRTPADKMQVIISSTIHTAIEVSKALGLRRQSNY